MKLTADPSLEDSKPEDKLVSQRRRLQSPKASEQKKKEGLRAGPRSSKGIVLEGTVAERIRAMRNHLASAELAVANVLVENYPTAGLVPIVQLASTADVSAPTVLRLVDKLGFTGFGEFHEALLTEIQARLSSPVDTYPSPSIGDGPSTPAKRAAVAYSRSIGETFSQLDTKEVASAINVLSDVARPVFVLGGRFSIVLASQLVSYLSILRRGVRHVGPDSRDRLATIMDVGPDAVTVVFDYRHYQKSSQDWGIDAVKRGAHLIVVTDQYLSPLAPRATTMLTTKSKGLAPFDSMAAGFALNEMLISEVARRLGEPARARLASYVDLHLMEEASYSR